MLGENIPSDDDKSFSFSLYRFKDSSRPKIWNSLVRVHRWRGKRPYLYIKKYLSASYSEYDERVGRKSLRNWLHSVPDLTRDISGKRTAQSKTLSKTSPATAR